MNATVRRHPRTLAECWGGRWPEPGPISGPYRAPGRLRRVADAAVRRLGQAAALLLIFGSLGLLLAWRG